jgi:PAS domain S-box-containing protein
MITSAEPVTLADSLRRGTSPPGQTLPERLALLERFNELLIDCSGDCILLVDSEGMVRSINRMGRELLEVDSAEAVSGHHWSELFREFETKIRLNEPRLHASRSTFHAASKSKKGDQKYWTITFSAVDKGENPDCFLLVARDVTEHILVEKALRKSEEAFRKLFEENPIGIVLAKLDLSITKVNNALCAMLGFSERELVEHKLSDPRFGPSLSLASEMQRLVRGEIRSFQFETIFQTRRKQPLWAHVTTSVLRDGDNVPFQVFQMVENIQDRKSSEEQLLAYQEQLQSLASELSLSEERERRRIATNLHDRIGQSLAFARLKLASLSGQGGIKEVRELIEQAIIDTRSLTFELSPPVLYELGLVPALEWLARKIQQDHGIQTKFHDDGQPKPMEDNFRVVLFQAVRELLVNVVKHARATHARVLLRREADALRIIVEDDGVGFEVSNLAAKADANRTFGLFNIRERVEYLGGRVKIRSEPGSGTRVTLMAPLKVETISEQENERPDHHRRRP